MATPDADPDSILRPAPTPRVEDRWRAGGSGEAYGTRRFKNARAAGRDPARIERILVECGLDPATARVLDAPCGAGRLAPMLARRAALRVGADASLPMLSQARGTGERLVLARVEELPFSDGTFDAVVACRLLHHLGQDDELLAALRELVRVSRGWIVATFWDAASWHALRRRTGLRAQGGRAAVARSRLAEALREAGAEPVRWRHSLRFVSQQAYVAARKRGGA